MISSLIKFQLLHSKLVNFIHEVWHGNLIIYEINHLKVFSGASKRDRNNVIRV